MTVLRNQKKLSELEAKLDALSPLKVMSRGFAVASDMNNRIIRSEKELRIAKDFLLRFSDGSAVCKVMDYDEKEMM